MTQMTFFTRANTILTQTAFFMTRVKISFLLLRESFGSTRMTFDSWVDPQVINFDNPNDFLRLKNYIFNQIKKGKAKLLIKSQKDLISKLKS